MAEYGPCALGLEAILQPNHINDNIIGKIISCPVMNDIFD